MLVRNMFQRDYELVPEYDQNLGFRYVEAEQFMVGPVTEAIYLIRKLYEAGVFLKKYRDKAIACPTCLSPVITVRYLCVSCGSSNIEKEQKLEHACGFSGTEKEFTVQGEWNCPKCGKTTGKEELREINVHFRCTNCQSEFEKPTWMHYCKKCKFNFTLNEASFIDVYSYVLSEEAKRELEQGLISTNPIIEVFERNGFTVTSPGSLKGKTGGVHSFDILCRGSLGGKNSVLGVDLAYVTDPLDLSHVSTLMGKILDSGLDHGILVVTPTLDRAGKNLAELYDIELVEAETSQAAAEEIERRLRKLRNQGG